MARSILYLASHTIHQKLQIDSLKFRLIFITLVLGKTLQNRTGNIKDRSECFATVRNIASLLYSFIGSDNFLISKWIPFYEENCDDVNAEPFGIEMESIIDWIDSNISAKSKEVHDSLVYYACGGSHNVDPTTTVAHEPGTAHLLFNLGEYSSIMLRGTNKV